LVGAGWITRKKAEIGKQRAEMARKIKSFKIALITSN
jgi:hypothetical protein